MKPRRAGNGGDPGKDGLSDSARVRRGTADFLPSFVALQEAVREACALQTRWEARIVAGIKAALEFGAAHPAQAHALIVVTRQEEGRDAGLEEQLIAHFSRLLSEVAPPTKRYPISTDRSIIESIATISRGLVLAGRPEDLPSLAPELAYLALMPYAGIDGARQWSQPPLLAHDVDGTS